MDELGSGRRADSRHVATIVDFCLITVGALLLLLPSLISGVPKGHDYPHHIPWIEAFTAQMTAGDLYPRWLEGLWLGAGGADFFFYAPLPFWLAGVFRGVACSDCGADQLIMFTGLVTLALSGLGFRALARRFAGRWPAIAAALIYMALPYHFGVDWYDRLAIAEFMAAAILPWHLLAFLECAEGKKSGPRLAFLSGLIALCHLPTAMIVTVGYLVLLFCIERAPGWRSIAIPVLAAVVGLGLGAIYWIPAVMLLESARIELLALPKLAWELNILLPENFGRSPFYDSIWLPFAVLSVASAAALFVMPRGGRAIARIAAALLVVVWLMVTPLSVLLWETTPIARVQFPWRFLILADLAFGLAALTVAEAMMRRDHTKLRRGVAGALLCIIALVTAFEYPEIRGPHGSGGDPGAPIRVSAGALEWMPSEASSTIGQRHYTEIFEMAELLATHPTILLLGPGQVEVVSIKPRALTFEADLQAPQTVVFRRTFWRFWRLRDAQSGREIDLELTTDFPLITAELPAGRARYVLEIPVLMVEWLGGLISLFSLAVLLRWWWLTRRRKGS